MNRLRACRFRSVWLAASALWGSASLLGCKPQPPTKAPLAQQAPARKLAKVKRPPKPLLRPLPPLRLETDDDYHEPSPEITALLTAPDPPEPLVHPPSGRVALVYHQELMPLDRLARPFLGLAGYRFDPLTGTSRGDPLIEKVEFVSTDKVSPPVVWQPVEGSLLEQLSFSPSGRYAIATLIPNGPARLTVFDIKAGRATTLDVPIQAAWGPPCQWLGDTELLCRVLPADRPPPPKARPRPNVLEHVGGLAPSRTYSNLLSDAQDERLFDYHFVSTLARVSVDDGSYQPLEATRGLISEVQPSPNSQYAVITRLKRPYSRFVQADRFPRDIEILDLASGSRLRKLELPHDGAQPTRGPPEGPRAFSWRPGSTQTLGWVSRDVDPHGKAGDRWMGLDPPFNGTPRRFTRSPLGIWQFGWTTGGTPYFMTQSSGGTQAQVYLLRNGQTQLVWKGATEDVSNQPGRALRTGGDHGAIVEYQGRVFLASDGFSAEGARPYLDELDLTTLKSKRLYTSASGEVEQALALLDPESRTILTWRQTRQDAPSLRAVRGGETRTLWEMPHPYPALAGAKRSLIEYQRADGVRLFATLYLPPSYNGDGVLPTLLWIYPSEFTEQRYAELPHAKSNHFQLVKGPSPLCLLLAGYAVVYNPTIPIIGAGGTANDDYLPQLVASAEAAVQKVVQMGVADPERIAVAGRSYGAFSAANLLVHTRLFRTAIAISGAYNRTLTPFGFQRESRSFWRAQDMYARVSPFFQANQVEAPLLLIHGLADENAGTPPEQSERFFHALVGNGAAVRLVRLPYEGHQYYARESVLHIAAEMVNWLDRTM